MKVSILLDEQDYFVAAFTNQPLAEAWATQHPGALVEVETDPPLDSGKPFRPRYFVELKADRSLRGVRVLEEGEVAQPWGLRDGGFCACVRAVTMDQAIDLVTKMALNPFVPGNGR